ncbi:VanZ family protein [Arenibacterium sp. CAU 1754]
MSDDTRPNARLRKIALIATGLVAVLIAIASLAPPPDMPGPPGHDKLGHGIAYALLILPIAALIPRMLVWGAPLALIYGAAIEVIQPSFGRSCEALDLLADAVGILAGAMIGFGIFRIAMARRTERVSIAPKE